MKVQEALKAAIEAFELHAKQYPHMVKGYCVDALEDCKSALSDIGKCEPVINLNILKYTEHGVIPDDFKGQASGYRAGWNDCLSSVQYMFSQPIEKCEPVGELILDPVFLPALKAPLVNWKINLVDLEVGTKFYTSPQPIEKCEPVYLIVSGADEIVVTKEKYDSWTSAKRISYTSPISKEWVGLSDQQIQNLIINSDNYNKFQFIKSVEHTVKQLNAEKG